MSIILNIACNMQYKADKARAFKRVHCFGDRVGLMIVDIPEDLSISMVFSPPSLVPKQNTMVKNFLSMVFDFGSSLVYDNEVLLFFHLDQLQLRADIKGYMKTYHFSLLMEWTRINRLPITSGRDSSKTISESCIIILFIPLSTCIIDFYLIHCISCFILLQTLKFCIQLLVRSYLRVPSSTFSIRPMVELDSLGINVAVDDVLFNLVTKDTQLMKGSIPQKRGRKKDLFFLQMLIESTMQVDDIVLVCTASIGTQFLVKLSFMAM